MFEDSPKTDTAELQNFNGMYTCSTIMQEIFVGLTKAATADVPVFIWGETGTGKELTARALHEESDRKGSPFLSYNCANFSDSLMESQLFGHKKGSFTGAVNDQIGLLGAVGEGTLFLDEVTTMDLNLQAKLLRVLQEREYSEIGSVKPIPFKGRILSASQIPLEQAVQDLKFRADLRYRLEVITIHLPPLRDRSGDVMPLFEKFLVDSSADSSGLSISAEALGALSRCDWPGNIRQLQNSALFALAMSDGKNIELTDLPADVGRHFDKLGAKTNRAGDRGETHGRRATDHNRRARDQRPSRRKTDFDKRVSEMSQEELQLLLSAHGDSRVRAAASMGVSRMTLWRAMKKQGLT